MNLTRKYFNSTTHQENIDLPLVPFSSPLFASVCIRLIYSVGKNLTEHGDKLDEETKKEVQTAIDEAKALGSEADVETIKNKVSALSQASMKIGQAMYGKKGDSTNADESSEEKKTEAKEAEYEDKKDGKK